MPLHRDEIVLDVTPESATVARLGVTSVKLVSVPAPDTPEVVKRSYRELTVLSLEKRTLGESAATTLLRPGWGGDIPRGRISTAASPGA